MLAIEREQIPAPAVEGQPLEIVVGGNNQPPPVGVLFPNIGFGFGDPLALPQQPNIPTGAGFIALARLDIPDEGSFNPGGAGLPGPNVDLADIAPLEDQSQGRPPSLSAPASPSIRSRSPASPWSWKPAPASR